MSNEPFNELIYNSTYRHGVDPKRRVQIPAKWRPSQPEVRFTLIPWPHKGMKSAFISVLPPEVMRELTVKLKGMPYSDPKSQALRRLLGGRSDSIVMDSAGRITIPEEMAIAADVLKDAVLVGTVDRFEIWNPKRHAEMNQTDEALIDEAFGMI